MEVLLSFLPLAGCAVMMALCMGFLGGARRHRTGVKPESQAASTEEVAALREEVARLRADRSAEGRRPEG
jgi:hypothetical protein